MYYTHMSLSLSLFLYQLIQQTRYEQTAAATTLRLPFAFREPHQTRMKVCPAVIVMIMLVIILVIVAVLVVMMIVVIILIMIVGALSRPLERRVPALIFSGGGRRVRAYRDVSVYIYIYKHIYIYVFIHTHICMHICI